MRSLEEKMCSGNASSIANLRDRGIETYALDLGKKKFDIKNRKRRCTDDIFDSIMEHESEDMKEIKEAKSEVSILLFKMINFYLLIPLIYGKIDVLGYKLKLVYKLSIF
jgi:hypothetical protein